jgi:hypothetical protein
LFAVSATHALPDRSYATPRGVLNCPGAEPAVANPLNGLMSPSWPA